MEDLICLAGMNPSGILFLSNVYFPHAVTDTVVRGKEMDRSLIVYHYSSQTAESSLSIVNDLSLSPFM